MRSVLFFGLCLFACNKSDPAKDKEIAELRAKLAQQSAPSSFGSVGRDAQPQISPPENKTMRSEDFPTNMKGQLDRIEYELLSSPMDALVNDQADTLGLHKDGIGSKFVIKFANRPDMERIKTYNQLWESPGKPWRQRVILLEIMPSKPGSGFHGRASLDYYQNMTIYLYSRHPMKFHAGDQVDIMGYVTELYTYTTTQQTKISIPGVAVVAVMKPGSILKFKPKTSKPR